MSSRTIKKLLLSLIVVGVLASFTVGGTFAVLSGQGGNANTSIASGTLLMSNTVGTAAPCLSKNGAVNVNTGCDVLFTSGLLYPILTTTPAATEYMLGKVTIANTGTLAGTLKTYMASCTASQTTGSPAAGGTNPCGTGVPGNESLDLQIQEYTSSAFTTPMSSCYWPAATGTACAFTSQSFGDFNAFHHDNTHYLSLGSIAAGQIRYFGIVVAEPIDASNGLQGETATFSLYWHMD
jgi:hypothetical protein